MSINILQFLKQGVSSKKHDKANFEQNSMKLENKQKEANLDYKTYGKFFHDDSSEQENEQVDQQARYKRDKYLTQKINHIKKINNIKVEGDSYPSLCSNFTKIIKKYKLKSKLINRLSSYGFTKPTAVQMQSIPLLLQKRNVLITAPTGSGKTISFALPLLQNLKPKGLQGVIIEPFFELAEQVFKTVEDLGKDLNLKIRSVSHLKKVDAQFDANIFVSTPMAFITYFKQKPQLLSKVQYLILDESDKYFQQSFLQQIREILSMFSDVNPVYGLFSATIQHPVQELLKQEILDDAVRVQVGGKNNVLSKIAQTLDYCSNQFGKLVQIRNMILNGRFVPPVLMFVQQKERAKQLFFEMKKILKQTVRAPQRVEYVTAEKFKHNRQDILKRFDEGEIWVLVATDLMARGVDFKMVNLVINYDFPTSMLTYIHRVGRTGRGDREGTAVTFFTDEDKPQLRSLANLLKVSGCQVPQWIFNLPLASKKARKNIQKRPVMRQSISRNPDKHVDPNWRSQIAIIEKKHQKKIQAEQKQKEKMEEEWQYC